MIYVVLDERETEPARRQEKLVERDKKKEVKARIQKRLSLIMTFAVVLHVGILALLKYTPFAISNINAVSSCWAWILPWRFLLSWFPSVFPFIPFRR